MSGAPQGGIDLPPELQRELRDLAAREGRISHYELLGVRADAAAAEVRRAYLERSRRFHPDSWYRKNLGEYAPLLQRTFQRITKAYEVLSDEDSRAAYDAANVHLLPSEEREALRRRQLSREDEDRRARERRERLLRSKGFARIGAARQLFGEAVQQAENGDRAQAIATLKAARELDPARKEIADKLAELEREASKARLASGLASASSAEEDHDYTKGLSIFANVFAMEPKCWQAAVGAARCALGLGDATQAATWATRAIEIAPGQAEPHLVAARAWSKLKLKPRAKVELQIVLKTQPDHPEAKALWKAL